MTTIKFPGHWIRDFLELLFPRQCVVCGKQLIRGEEFICLFCLQDLPRTGYASLKENPVKRLFHGRLDVSDATAMLNFEKANPAQKVIHQLKYRNNPEIGTYFGRLIAAEMKSGGNFKDIDLVIPVPLHRTKRISRGYNQCEYIANGIAGELGIGVEKSLVKRTHKSETQTKKGRYERWKNVSSVFHCKAKKDIEGKHLLIVDDVITTGATLEACAVAILKNYNVRISIATVARSA